MSRKPFTGGELNKLNGKAGISAPNNSVSVSRLVKYHKPKSAAELEKLISDHQNNNCPCGVVSTGTVQDFGKNLYDAQIPYWGVHKFSLKDCIQWEYDLFILQMLKGSTMENKCRLELQNSISDDFFIKETNHFVDEELRVDLEISHNGSIIVGIQVKPSSFKNIRKNIKEFNKNANLNYNNPVFYIYYDYDSEKFINLDEIAALIENLV